MLNELAALDIEPHIVAKPYGVPMTEPFATDTAHASYDPEYVGRFHHVLLFADETLKTFSGWFNGKSSPVHLFWHSFDLALTRFSGRRAPEMPAADPVTREASSREVIGFGFWTGDATVPAPAFYSYTAPEPAGLALKPLQPAASDMGATKRQPSRRPHVPRTCATVPRPGRRCWRFSKVRIKPAQSWLNGTWTPCVPRLLPRVRSGSDPVDRRSLAPTIGRSSALECARWRTTTSNG